MHTKLKKNKLVLNGHLLFGGQLSNMKRIKYTYTNVTLKWEIFFALNEAIEVSRHPQTDAKEKQKKRKKEKYSFEPDSNQRPKDT